MFASLKKNVNRNNNDKRGWRISKIDCPWWAFSAFLTRFLCAIDLKCALNLNFKSQHCCTNVEEAYVNLPIEAWYNRSNKRTQFCSDWVEWQ